MSTMTKDRPSFEYCLCMQMLYYRIFRACVNLHRVERRGLTTLYVCIGRELGMSNLTSKLGQIGPKWDRSGTY